MTDRQGSMLIVGIGNPDRGDDAAGRAAAAGLKARGPKDLRVIESDGEATALLAWFSEADEVILIDAALSGATPGTVGRFDVNEAALPTGRFGISTHGFGLAEAIELARTLGCLPRRCVVYVIEGRSFALGERLSPEVEAAVEAVIATILDTISVKAG
jgi:hydrogenase maturation protease